MAHLLMIESWLRFTGEALPALLRARGHRFTLVTADPDRYDPPPGSERHPVLALADDVVVTDTDDVAALVAIATGPLAGAVDGVLTTCDYYLEAVAAVAGALGHPGPSAAAVRVARRKDLVREAISRAGLPNPGFAAADDETGALAAAERLGYPLVAKPVDLNSSTLVRLVHGPGELADTVRAVRSLTRNTRHQPLARRILLEEVLSGPEVSVEAYTRDGVTTVIGVTDKSVTGAPAFVESGHQFPAPLPAVDTEAASQAAVAALTAVGWSHGLSHTEIMLTPDGPRIVEINPRQGGNYIFDLVGAVTGTNVLDVMIDLALGDEPAPPPGGRPVAGLDAPPASAAVHFVLCPRDGHLIDVSGTDRLDADPAVWRWSVPTGVDVRRPGDNESYVGHVLTVDAGADARRRAAAAVAGLVLHFDDGSSTPAVTALPDRRPVPARLP